MERKNFEETQPPEFAKLEEDKPEVPLKQETKSSPRTLDLRVLILSVILGLIVGYLLSFFEAPSEALELIGLPGDLFIRFLKCLVLPLIFSSIVCSFANINQVQRGTIGVLALIWYIMTTVIACISGLVWIYVFRPWVFYKADPNNEVDPSLISLSRTPLDSVFDLFRQMVPDNIVKAAIQLNLLGIITFALILGITLSMINDAGKPLLRFIESLNKASMKMINWVIFLSPLGIFSLIAYNLGTSGDFWGVLASLGVLIACRFVGVIFHGLFTLPLIYFLTTRRNPYRYLYNMTPAFLLAFGTSSSAATLPMTIKCCEENNKISPAVANFVCSTGANVNMDAAAIAYAMSPIFLFNVLNIPLSLGQAITIVISATLVSIGAPAIPSPGLVNYIAVITSVGLPVEQSIAIISPILSVDWLEDRIMTIVNIEGDAYAAGFVEQNKEKNFFKRKDNSD